MIGGTKHWNVCMRGAGEKKIEWGKGVRRGDEHYPVKEMLEFMVAKPEKKMILNGVLYQRAHGLL